MTRFAVLAIVACSSPAATSTTPPASVPAPTDAATPSVTAPPSDAAAVDSELAAAPPSIFRFYSTGLVVTKDGPRLETWTLRHAGTRATILVERMRPSGDAWTPGTTTRYVGTVSDDGTTLAFALAAGPNPLALACTHAKLPVAAATAVRKPHARRGRYARPCSGDPGRWVPDQTRSTEVLSCKHPDFESPMPFAAAPGVEYLYVNDDCEQQGGGYRAIASDGTIAPVR